MCFLSQYLLNNGPQLSPHQVLHINDSAPTLMTGIPFTIGDQVAAVSVIVVSVVFCPHEIANFMLFFSCRYKTLDDYLLSRPILQRGSLHRMSSRLFFINTQFDIMHAMFCKHLLSNSRYNHLRCLSNQHGFCYGIFFMCLQRWISTQWCYLLCLYRGYLQEHSRERHMYSLWSQREFSSRCFSLYLQCRTSTKWYFL